MGITVRKADAGDSEALLAAMKRADAFYASQIPIYSEASPQVLEFFMKNGVVLVAEIDGVLVGTLSGALHPNVLNPSIAQLSALVWWVEPEHQRRGVGSALLTHFTEAARGSAKWVSLSIQEKTAANLPAELLAGLGYRPAERVYLREVV